MNEKNLRPNGETVFNVEEYQKSERRSASKNEFFDGKILAATQSNRVNNLIATNITIAVGSRLQGQKCEIYVNDMRVRLDARHVCYPDVAITSGAPAFADAGEDTLLNPTVVFEVFSKNTDFQDKTERLECYLAMPSVREYLLVKEDETRVEHYFKQNPKQWIYRIYNLRDEVVSIESINCKISLKEIYAQIKFGAAEVKSQSVN